MILLKFLENLIEIMNTILFLQELNIRLINHEHIIEITLHIQEPRIIIIVEVDHFHLSDIIAEHHNFIVIDMVINIFANILIYQALAIEVATLSKLS